MKIFIKSNTPEGMIRNLKNYGIYATDCSVSAEPQVYTLLIDGIIKHNVILFSDNSYVFEKIGDNFTIKSCNPTIDEIETCDNYIKNHPKSKDNDFMLTLVAIPIFIVLWIIIFSIK